MTLSLETYNILKVLSEAHFFCRMASDREEKKAKLELLE